MEKENKKPKTKGLDLSIGEIEELLRSDETRLINTFNKIHSEEQKRKKDEEE